MMTLSDEGLALVKSSEGFRSTLYNDAAGHCTIGFGHLVHYGPVGMYPKLEAPFKHGITEQEALALLRADLERFEGRVRLFVVVPIDQSEFDALVDLIYNVGIDNFARSTLLKKLNAGDYDGAGREFDRWVFAGGKRLAGLAVRRNSEEALFSRNLPRRLATQ